MLEQISAFQIIEKGQNAKHNKTENYARATC